MTMVNQSFLTPHLILHFDVNKTIVCFDQVQDLNVDETLTLLFAERIATSWRRDLDPMTYKRYVKKFVVPGSELHQEVKKQRLRQYQHLWDDLKRLDPSMYDHYKKEWKKVRDLLTNHHVFPSFFFLLRFLQHRHIPHSIILRTFGEDLDLVIAEIHQNFPDLKFERGKFSKGSLYLDQGVISDFNEIHDFFSKHHMAIQDDHHHWHYQHREQSTGAKPFPFKIDGDVITIFFDDNLKSKQIVQVIDLDRPARHPSYDELFQQGYLHPVDTLKAIEDEGYFVNHIRQFFR